MAAAVSSSLEPTTSNESKSAIVESSVPCMVLKSDGLFMSSPSSMSMSIMSRAASAASASALGFLETTLGRRPRFGLSWSSKLLPGSGISTTFGSGSGSGSMPATLRTLAASKSNNLHLSISGTGDGSSTINFFPLPSPRSSGSLGDHSG